MRKYNITSNTPADVPTKLTFLDQQVRALAQASQENDTIDIASGFTIVGAFTTTRTLNVSTATLANVIALIATLLTDLKAGGANRTT